MEGSEHPAPGELALLRRRAADAERLELEIAQLRAERVTLQAAEIELRAMFQAMVDVVLVLNREGRYVKIAPTAVDLLYRPSHELLGRTLHEIMPPDMAAMFLSAVIETLDFRRIVTIDYSLPIQGAHVFFTATLSPMSEDNVMFVARDVTERKTMEEALRRSQEELIRAQEAALAMLSTPLIPIHRKVVVMPLIGALDASRIDRIMEALLQGTQARRARVTILDLTGVSAVSSQVADGLLRVARAVRMLGSRVVLTGMHPDVARKLVEIGADLSDIVTLGTVQAGVAYAMTRAR